MNFEDKEQAISNVVRKVQHTVFTEHWMIAVFWCAKDNVKVEKVTWQFPYAAMPKAVAELKTLLEEEIDGRPEPLPLADICKERA